MKCNYPVYYSVMTIMGKGLKDYYIPMKCFLTENNIKYLPLSGKTKKTYNVIFTYRFNEEKNCFIKFIPSSSTHSKDVEVEKIFTTFDEAKKEVVRLYEENLDLMNFLSRIGKNSYEMDKDKIIQFHKTAEEIEKNTDYLSVNPQPKNHNIRVFFKRGYQTITENNNLAAEKRYFEDNVNIYQFIEGNKSQAFKAYTVTPAQFNALEKTSNDTLWMNLRRLNKAENLIAYNNGKVNINYLKDGYCFTMDGLLRCYKDEYGTDFNPHLVIYTTESYNDIINSYLPLPAENNETPLIFKKLEKTLILPAPNPNN